MYIIEKNYIEQWELYSYWWSSGWNKAVWEHCIGVYVCQKTSFSAWVMRAAGTLLTWLCWAILSRLSLPCIEELTHDINCTVSESNPSIKATQRPTTSPSQVTPNPTSKNWTKVPTNNTTHQCSQDGKPCPPLKVNLGVALECVLLEKQSLSLPRLLHQAIFLKGIYSEP